MQELINSTLQLDNVFFDNDMKGIVLGYQSSVISWTLIERASSDGYWV